MKKVDKIINYLERPKVIGRIESLNANKVEFDPYVLGDMVNELSPRLLNDLLEKVETVCQHWNGLRVAPNNDIGIIARYQECKLWIEKRLGKL